MRRTLGIPRGMIFATTENGLPIKNWNIWGPWGNVPLTGTIITARAKATRLVKARNGSWLDKKWSDKNARTAMLVGMEVTAYDVFIQEK